MYIKDYPDHFEERYEDPEYDEWEKQTLIEIGDMTEEEYEEWNSMRGTEDNYSEESE